MSEEIDHLAELKALSADCVETAIELLPTFNEGRSAAATTELVVHLLVHLRAIQIEANELGEERKP